MKITTILLIIFLATVTIVLSIRISEEKWETIDQYWSTQEELCGKVGWYLPEGEEECVPVNEEIYEKA